MTASKTHPCSSAKRRSITLHYDISSSLLAAGVFPLASPKKLKRLPHIFCRVLELPCSSETPVEISDQQDRYIFVIQQPGLVAEEVEVEVEVIEIVPGATKVVVGRSDGIRAALEEREVDLWRFRLPPSTLPEAATAIYQDGVFSVTVPKAGIPLSTEVRLEKTLVETGRDSNDSAREESQSDGDPRSDGRSGQGHTTGSGCDSKGDTVPDE